jgi:hypothetical protein
VGMKKIRKQLSLAPDIINLLERVGNISDYIDHVVRQRFQRATQALYALQRAGWKPNEILAACDVLNGPWRIVHAPTLHWDSMVDGFEFVKEWDITPDRWLELTKQVSTSEHLAFSIDLVVSEYWAGNNYIKKLLTGAEDD